MEAIQTLNPADVWEVAQKVIVWLAGIGIVIDLTVRVGSKVCGMGKRVQKGQDRGREDGGSCGAVEEDC